MHVGRFSGWDKIRRGQISASDVATGRVDGTATYKAVDSDDSLMVIWA
jgi:hypothetical protein